MNFWESVKLGLGLEQRGNAPAALVLNNIDIGIPPFKISWRAIPEICNDKIWVSDLLGQIFIEKEIWDAPLEKEHPQYVLKSLDNLYTTVDGGIKNYSNAIGERDNFYDTLLIIWRSNLRTHTKALQESLAKESKDRIDYNSGEIMEANEIYRAQDDLPEIIYQFRKTGYPVVKVLLDLLPEENPIHNMTRRKLASVKANLETRVAEKGENYLEEII